MWLTLNPTLHQPDLFCKPIQHCKTKTTVAPTQFNNIENQSSYTLIVEPQSVFCSLVDIVESFGIKPPFSLARNTAY